MRSRGSSRATENINELFFVAAFHEYVALASELLAAEANDMQINVIIRKCQLESGPFDYTNHGERNENLGSRQQNRVELLIMKRFE